MRWPGVGVEGGTAPESLSNGELDGRARLCAPDGFMSQLVRAPSTLRDAANRSPGTVLCLLLGDLEGRQSRSQIHRWIVGHGLLGPRRFSAWWTDLQAGGDPQLHWQAEGVAMTGSQEAWTDLSALPPASAQRTFIKMGPTARCRVWRDAGDALRDSLLDGAVEASDLQAIRLCLRGRRAVPGRHIDVLNALAMGGRTELGATLLMLRDPQMLAGLATTAGHARARSLVRRTLASLPRDQRTDAILALMTTALASQGGEVTTLFLAGELPDGLQATLASLDVATESHPDHDAILWLRTRGAESTIDHPVVDSCPLLTNLAPLDESQIVPLSVALARSLQERHSAGGTATECSGISWAWWHSLCTPSKTGPKSAGEFLGQPVRLSERAAGF
jgi:hypothetical protein